MQKTKNRLYSFLILGSIAGYIWIYLNLTDNFIGNTQKSSVCLIKHFTNIPCPSCGSTRSVLSILKGEFLTGLYLNPLGFILLSILIITPLWIGYDYIKKKNSLLLFYYKTESFLRQKRIAIPAILLVLANWFWNIHKGL